ncbi:hypothetical protein Dimus_005063 [Dionaea muscipula]
MELIKSEKWEKLFKRRELVYVDLCRGILCKIDLETLEKKEVAHSSVRGVEIEFDHMKLASILGIPGNNGIYEYIKDVCEESKYIKPLEITKKFANDETIMATRRKKRKEEEEARNSGFDWEVVVDEATDRGNTDRMIDFLMHELMLRNQQRSTDDSGTDSDEESTPRPLRGIHDAIFDSLQADFERARANRIERDLEKARVRMEDL